MANVRSGNTYYIDTASSGGPPATTNILDVKDIRVVGIRLRATASGSVFVLVDNSASQPIQWTGSINTATGSNFVNLSEIPIRFPNGIAVTTLTNCVAILIVREANK